MKKTLIGTSLVLKINIVGDARSFFWRCSFVFLGDARSAADPRSAHVGGAAAPFCTVGLDTCGYLVLPCCGGVAGAADLGAHVGGSHSLRYGTWFGSRLMA